MSLRDVGVQKCPKCGRPTVTYLARGEILLRAHKSPDSIRWCGGYHAADQSLANVVNLPAVERAVGQ